MLQHTMCSDDTSGAVQAIVVHWDREKSELECSLREDLHQMGVQHSQISTQWGVLLRDCSEN